MVRASSSAVGRGLISVSANEPTPTTTAWVWLAGAFSSAARAASPPADSTTATASAPSRNSRFIVMDPFMSPEGGLVGSRLEKCLGSAGGAKGRGSRCGDRPRVRSHCAYLAVPRQPILRRP